MDDETQIIGAGGTTEQQSMDTGSWDINGKASVWWYLAGISVIGNFIAIFYVLFKGGKKRFLSILYLLGLLGTAIVYFLSKDDDKKLADLSAKLFIGNFLFLVIILLYAVYLTSSIMYGVRNAAHVTTFTTIP